MFAPWFRSFTAGPGVPKWVVTVVATITLVGVLICAAIVTAVGLALIFDDQAAVGVLLTSIAVGVFATCFTGLAIAPSDRASFFGILAGVLAMSVVSLAVTSSPVVLALCGVLTAAILPLFSLRARRGRAT